MTLWSVFALSDGGTSRPADVVEQSALSRACGLTRVEGRWCCGSRDVCRHSEMSVTMWVLDEDEGKERNSWCRQYNSSQRIHVM